MTGPPPTTEGVQELGEEGTLVLEQHFAIVPEWVIDAEVSDAAYRLYSVLLRYGQSSGARMPSRALLARRLRRSIDSIDRALKELVTVGAVVVERRRRGRENLTNRYHLRHTPPPRSSSSSLSGGSRTAAATPAGGGGGRTVAATPGRTAAARVAAPVRPDPVVLTQENTPPPSAPTAAGRATRRRRDLGGDEAGRLCRLIGVEDLDALAERCREHRRRLGRPTGLWTTSSLGQVIHAAVHEEGWPATAVVPALLALAADPDTKSPARLTCPGPWWEAAERARQTEDGVVHAEELRALEARLAEVGGLRVVLQRRARALITAQGQALTRLAVARTACELLDLDQASVSGRATAGPSGDDLTTPACPTGLRRSG